MRINLQTVSNKWSSSRTEHIPSQNRFHQKFLRELKLFVPGLRTFRPCDSLLRIAAWGVSQGGKFKSQLCCQNNRCPQNYASCPPWRFFCVRLPVQYSVGKTVFAKGGKFVCTLRMTKKKGAKSFLWKTTLSLIFELESDRKNKFTRKTKLALKCAQPFLRGVFFSHLLAHLPFHLAKSFSCVSLYLSSRNKTSQICWRKFCKYLFFRRRVQS